MHPDALQAIEPGTEVAGFTGMSTGSDEEAAAAAEAAANEDALAQEQIEAQAAEALRSEADALQEQAVEGQTDTPGPEAVTDLYADATGLVVDPPEDTSEVAAAVEAGEIEDATQFFGEEAVVYLLTSPTYGNVGQGTHVVGVFASKEEAEAYRDEATPAVSDGTVSAWALG